MGKNIQFMKMLQLRKETGRIMALAKKEKYYDDGWEATVTIEIQSRRSIPWPPAGEPYVDPSSIFGYFITAKACVKHLTKDEEICTPVRRTFSN